MSHDSDNSLNHVLALRLWIGLQQRLLRALFCHFPSQGGTEFVSRYADFGTENDKALSLFVPKPPSKETPPIPVACLTKTSSDIKETPHVTNLAVTENQI